MEGSSVTAEPSPTNGQNVLSRWRTALAAAALLAITLTAYAPALTAGYIWDDQENVSDNVQLVSPDGLYQIWCVPPSNHRYSPLAYTSYWIEYRLWGLAPGGYHLTNILLHSVAAILAWRLFARLQIPGAWFAAALFAVHPVEVESVAWITEQKNVLSLTLVLLSMLCYLRFAPVQAEDRVDEIPSPARWTWYALALALFALALTAKTVVATMPAVMLMLYWWKRGWIRWSDVAYLLPFVALSVALVFITLRMEAHDIGTEGMEWSLPAIDRLLLAGRAVWFYVGKLLWPYPLAFFYPQWKLDGQQWLQYLWPIAALVLLVVLWFATGRLGRGPFTAAVTIAIVLAPTLGFFNNYFMVYSYVADHFQYHASLAILALAAAAGALASARLGPPARQVSYFFAGLLLLGLGGMTFRQTFVYHDLETLYRDTIAKNPNCTTAFANLAVILSERGDHEEAVSLTRSALLLDPDDPLAHINLGTYLLHLGNRDGFKPDQLQETIDHLQQGLALAHAAWGTAPNEARLRNYLGNCLMQTGFSTGFQPELLDKVIAQMNEALRLDPDYVDAHANIALALVAADRSPEAIEHAARALELEPSGVGALRDQIGPDLLADAHCARGAALASKGDFAAAEAHYRAAIELRPDHDRAPNNLGVVLMNLGQTDEAIHWFEEALLGDPKYAEAKANLDKARQVQSNQTAPK